MPSRTGPILAFLSEFRKDLPQTLQEAGLAVMVDVPPQDASQREMSTPEVVPLLVVSDQPLDLEPIPHLLHAIKERQVGLILIGAAVASHHEGPVSPDATLPDTATPREIVQSTRLVAEIVTLRRTNQQQRDQGQQWQHLALHDALTQLPNRRQWDEELRRRMNGDEPFVLAMVDVDLFKQINDKDGHNTGDDVLCEVGHTLRDRIRQDDFVARLGGDEFGLLLSRLGETEAKHVIDRLRDAVSAHLCLCQLPKATLSAGCVLVQPTQRRTIKELYATASKSLQAAKQSNRNRTVLEDPAPITPELRQ